jgi:phosphoribosylanthranilate isomerase
MAKAICLALPLRVTTVGVFVNETFSTVMRKVERCHLRAVQLHGQESSDLVYRLRKENIAVIKALFVDGSPGIDEISHFDASAFLVECGKGTLPGGNALHWNWGDAKGIGKKYPLILAGGLTPENVSEAIYAALPDAVDVSSGVESSPGSKDPDKAVSFIESVSRCKVGKKTRQVFQPRSSIQSFLG